MFAFLDLFTAAMTLKGNSGMVTKTVENDENPEASGKMFHGFYDLSTLVGLRNIEKLFKNYIYVFVLHLTLFLVDTCIFLSVYFV